MLKFPTIIFSLDDFSEEIMTQEMWKCLLDLKTKHPYLKTTMYTVPMLCSRAWLEWIRNKYPWIELHYHGSNHKDKNEWFDKKNISLPHQDLFYKGFKAPWYRMNQSTANYFNINKFIISAKRGKFDVKLNHPYRFNEGKEILKNICYEIGGMRSINSHIQPMKQKLGLPDIFDSIVNLINSPKSIFVSQTTFEAS